MMPTSQFPALFGATKLPALGRGKPAPPPKKKAAAVLPQGMKARTRSTRKPRTDGWNDA